MRRRWWYGAVALVLVAVGIVAWRAWPRDPGPVAPQVTARQIRMINHQIMPARATLVGGGSPGEAHRLWVRYHDQIAFQGVKPRLIGVSRVRISSPRNAGTRAGYYWVVFCDRAWNPNLAGMGGTPGYYGREVVLVPVGSGTTGNITLF